MRLSPLAAAACLLFACAEGGGDAEEDPYVSPDAIVKSDSSGGDAIFPVDETGAETTGETTAPDTKPPPPTDTGPGCKPGEALCGGKCIPTYNDPDNCGGCGIKCADAPFGSRSCAASTCGFSCLAGHGDCDPDKTNGCETDLTSSLSNCGSCGKTCTARPNADATCSSGTCTDVCKGGFASISSYCSNFGGAYETHVASCSTCNNGNPFTSGACSCPAGFSASSTYVARNDACSALRAASIRFCETSGTGSAVFGGAYQLDDSVSCGAGCRVSNPKTGGCSCPSGYSAAMLRVTILNGCGSVIGSNIGVCVHGSAALDNFGGVYQQDDPVSGGFGCRNSNPRTGGCTCPSGFSSSSIRILADASGGGEIGSSANICTR